VDRVKAVEDFETRSRATMNLRRPERDLEDQLAENGLVERTAVLGDGPSARA
jgi:hypothetical protein